MFKIFKQLLRAVIFYGESSKLSYESIGTFSPLILFDKIVAVNFYYLGNLNIEKKGRGWNQEYVGKKSENCVKNPEKTFLLVFLS